ncbi:MAG TPA: hypothetical protein VJ715_13770 [Pyrinomonadaceae bacterium]|nr:hypothetical protein [Pyrinomonadaceae bacterium]
MKIKLAAFLAATMLALAGCGGASNTTNSTNTGNAGNRTGNATSSTTATPDPNMVKANANASDETGGTKEGCKCSAAGMKCSTEPGEKGCCGAKDGACSTMVDGKSSCCSSKGGEGGACCSAAGKMAAGDASCNPDAKPAATATKKS